MSHPTTELDDVVHQRTRLGILVVLSRVKRADFKSLKQILGLTDGNLSRSIQTLEQAGCVSVEKTFENRRPRTWISITSSGKSALKREIDALNQIIESVNAS